MMSEFSLPPEIPRIGPRDVHSHKGSFGRALLVGGSVGMSGSISLAGRACLRGGAGLVTLAVPDEIVTTVAGFEAAYMTWPLPTDREGKLPLRAKDRISRQLEQATCIGIGPGLGQSSGLQMLVRHLFTSVELPMVVDADGINLLARREQPLKGAAGPRIITPHLGEFRRLAADDSLDMNQAAKIASCMASASRVVMVLKGPRTLVTDGHQSYVNRTGNPGLATGGTGDVLTGLMTAMLAQGLPAFEAAVLAVYLHGLAADLAVRETSQPGLVATDLIDYLSDAWLLYFSSGG